ncbi:MAG TPA: alpha/beta hydrolase [Nocardioidaceae bacterium]|nr:alpha/beta hydrolase [Nocardioidaceae bacterium]
MKRLAAIAASATALAAVVSTQSATAAPDHRAGTQQAHHPAVASYTPPPLEWGDCTNATLVAIGAECSMLTVPLDYSRPHGTKIQLAVSRVQHRSSDADYQGVMLTNPGGPGGSGLVLSILGYGPIVPGTADDDYDWIGFDPRGVGSSQPALACDPGFFGYDRPSYIPSKRWIARTWLHRSADYAKACGRSAAAKMGLLNHVKTTDTVADMESLRKALGQRKINYYGFSYGTYLGQVYATLHPNRVRRFVLDSNVDPRKVWYQANLDQDIAFQKTIGVYFGWLAKHDDVFHLGTTQREVAGGFYAERRKLDRNPAGGVIGPDELTDVMLSAGYYVYDWVEIGQAYAALVNDGDYSAMKAMYDGANPQDTPGSDNGYAMYLATQCTDTQWPQSLRRIFSDNWRVHRKAPFETWANAWFNGPCSFWPAKAGRPVHVDGHRVHSKILLIDETLDAATPYAGSLEVRRRFPSASLIEGVGGTTHAGSLSGVACTDDAIAQYLADGTVPARKPGNRSDLQCPPVPQPEPTAAQARAQLKSAAPDGTSQRDAPDSTSLRDALRHELAQAQLR